MRTAATPPRVIAERGPHWSETHPTSGEPIGVVPRKNIM